MRARLLAGLLLVAAGCAPRVLIERERLEMVQPRSVAVLPFRLEGPAATERTRLQAAAVRAAVHRRFSVLPYRHLDPAQTDRRLRLAGLDDPAVLAQAPPPVIAAALEVDAYLQGTVTRLANFQGGLLYRQVLGGRVELVAPAGLLARVEYTATDTGGLLIGSSQALTSLKQTLDNSSDVGFLHLVEEFAAAVAAELPGPPLAPPVTQPAIEAVELAAGEGAILAAGDRVELTVRADPGLSGTFNLGSDLVGLPLFEEGAGFYRGGYTVAVGDRTSGPVTVTMTDPFGGAATRVLRDRPLRLEARPPGPPREVRLAPAGAAELRLDWSPPGGNPVSYRIYGLEPFGRLRALGEVPGPGVAVPPGFAVYLVAGGDVRGALGPYERVEAPER